MSKTIHLNDQSLDSHNSRELLVKIAASALPMYESDLLEEEGDYFKSGLLTLAVVPDEFNTDFLNESSDCSFHVTQNFDDKPPF